MTHTDRSSFADTVRSSDTTSNQRLSVLHVGKNVTLTLATDSLIVLDEHAATESSSFCCGLPISQPKPTSTIPYFNVLWAETSHSFITVKYARNASRRKDVRVAQLHYQLDKQQQKDAEAWVAELQERAYRGSQEKKRIKVLINPHGGKTNAQRIFLRDVEPIFAAARCELDVEHTRYQGHAIEIAEKLDTAAFDAVACCSGDGLPHEVFNGLGKKADSRAALAKIAVVQLPCGSGNAMSWNLNGTDVPSRAALCVVKGIRTALDLTSITQGNRRLLSFLSQAVGLVAEVDLATEHLRWMGSARFTYGFFARIMRNTSYPCDLAVKIEIASKPDIRERFRKEASNGPVPLPSSKVLQDREAPGLPRLQYGDASTAQPEAFTNCPARGLATFYAGNMALMAADANFFPASLPSDGLLDIVTINAHVSRVESIKTLLAVENGTFFDIASVKYQKASAYRLTPLSKGNGYISIDGERIPFEPFQAEVHKALGCTLSKSGHLYEAEAVVPKE